VWDTFITCLSLQRWWDVTASQRTQYQEVAVLANKRRLRAALARWKYKLKVKRQTAWQNGMQMKMNVVRDNRSAKLKKDAWAKWRQLYQSRLSDQHYAERLIHRFYQLWRRTLSEIERMEVIADDQLDNLDRKNVRRCWHHWRMAIEIRNSERTISERVELRLMRDYMNIWKKRL
jgi:protein SFI1